MYFLWFILLDTRMDVPTTKICLNTSILEATNMNRREHKIYLALTFLVIWYDIHTYVTLIYSLILISCHINIDVGPIYMILAKIRTIRACHISCMPCCHTWGWWLVVDCRQPVLQVGNKRWMCRPVPHPHERENGHETSVEFSFVFLRFSDCKLWSYESFSRFSDCKLWSHESCEFLTLISKFEKHP